MLGRVGPHGGHCHGRGWPGRARREAHRDGRPVRPEAFSDRFADLYAEADVPATRLHDVRHTVATLLYQSGFAPADAAGLLGHAVAVHLSTYVTSTERGTQTAATALGEALAAVRQAAASPTEWVFELERLSDAPTQYTRSVVHFQLRRALSLMLASTPTGAWNVGNSFLRNVPLAWKFLETLQLNWSLVPKIQANSHQTWYKEIWIHRSTRPESSANRHVNPEKTGRSGTSSLTPSLAHCPSTLPL